MNRQYRHACANCHRTFSSEPILGADRTYCCGACASRHLCTCLVEVDLADDGVDGLGLPFASDVPDRAALVRSSAS